MGQGCFHWCIHSFFNRMFIEHLLSTRLCSGYWGYISGHDTFKIGWPYNLSYTHWNTFGDGWDTINNYSGKSSMKQGCLKQTGKCGQSDLKSRGTICPKSEMCPCSIYPWIGIFPLPNADLWVKIQLFKPPNDIYGDLPSALVSSEDLSWGW